MEEGKVFVKPVVEGWEPNQEVIHHAEGFASFVAMDGIVHVGEDKDGLFLAMQPRVPGSNTLLHPSPALARHIGLEILRRTGTDIQWAMDEP